MLLSRCCRAVVALAREPLETRRDSQEVRVAHERRLAARMAPMTLSTMPAFIRQANAAQARQQQEHDESLPNAANAACCRLVSGRKHLAAVAADFPGVVADKYCSPAPQVHADPALPAGCAGLP